MIVLSFSLLAVAAKKRLSGAEMPPADVDRLSQKELTRRKAQTRSPEEWVTHHQKLSDARHVASIQTHLL